MQNPIKVSDNKGYSKVQKRCEELLEGNKYRMNDPSDSDPYSNIDFVRFIQEVTPPPTPDSTVIDQEKMPDVASPIATVTSTASTPTATTINPTDVILLGRERVASWDPLHEYN